MIESTKKILLIRFSSFGDVTQSLSIPSKLSKISQEIHWVTRADLAPLLTGHPHIKKIITLQRKDGLLGLWQLVRELKKERYTHIYDAHNNLRSHLICWLLQPPFALTRIVSPPQVLRKSQKRWKRLLLFKFRINTYRMPFSGQRDLLEPLSKWGLSEDLPLPPQIFIQNEADRNIQYRLQKLGFSKFIALAPSAAHVLKRWPVEHWKNLIKLLSTQKFIILGGPEDTFLENICKDFPEQAYNWAGQTSYTETTALIAQAQILVTNDTGVLHIAEQLGKSTIALMGPAPFGFPSRPTTKVMELDLSCRPCSKHGQGPCVNEKFHRCLVEITPEKVQQQVKQILERNFS